MRRYRAVRVAVCLLTTVGAGAVAVGGSPYLQHAPATAAGPHSDTGWGLLGTEAPLADTGWGGAPA